MTNRVSKPEMYGTTVSYPVNVNSDCTLDRALDGLARNGFRKVELCDAEGYCEHLKVNTIVEREVDAISKRLAKLDLDPITLSVSMDLTERTGLIKLGKVIQIARQLGVSKIITAIQATNSQPELDRFLANTREIEDVVSDSDCILLFETHNGHIGSGMLGMTLLEKIGSPYFGINYDTGNVLGNGWSPTKDLMSMGEGVAKYVQHVQLKDWMRPGKGEEEFPVFGAGDLDFAEALNGLHDGGYQGGMTIEVEIDGQNGPELIDQAIESSITYLEQFWR